MSTVLAVSGQLSWQVGQRCPQSRKLESETTESVPGRHPSILVDGGRTSDGLGGAQSRSGRTAGRRVPDRLLQVRVPPGFKLDPARRPKDWTTVAVPRRLGSADQKESGPMCYTPSTKPPYSLHLSYFSIRLTVSIFAALSLLFFESPLLPFSLPSLQCSPSGVPIPVSVCLLVWLCAFLPASWSLCLSSSLLQVLPISLPFTLQSLCLCLCLSISVSVAVSLPY